jgi:hypothetical protein
MNLNNIFFITAGILIADVIIIIIALITKNFGNERDKLKKEIEEYKKDYIDNINDVGLKVMSLNLLELKEYYTMTKIQYERTFIITTFFSSIGCVIILGGAIYGAVKGNFEITTYTTISGGVSEGVAALAFWMFTQAKNQLNLYSNHLRNNEKVLCAVNIIEKMNSNEKNENINKIVSYLLNEEK